MGGDSAAWVRLRSAGRCFFSSSEAVVSLTISGMVRISIWAVALDGTMLGRVPPLRVPRLKLGEPRTGCL